MHVAFVSLAELFPENQGIAELFDEDIDFLKGLRAAARDDLYAPDSRFSAEMNAKLRSPDSTLEGNWKACGPCEALSMHFESHGLTLDGITFMTRLGKLCETGGDVDAAIDASGLTTQAGKERRCCPYPVSGSWLDIVSPPRGRTRATHAWHQDSGLAQYTTILGFPKMSRYKGPGVFSHAVMLSHPLPPPKDPGPVIISDDVPEECVLRPVYRRGAEVMVYRDCDHFHSAPDHFVRDGIWRFM